MKNLFKKCLYTLASICCLFLPLIGHCQQLKLGTDPTQIDKSAALQIDSKNQGVLLPRIDDWNQITSFGPQDGMIVYYTDAGTSGHPDAGLYIRKDSKWQRLIVSDSVGIYSLNGDHTKAQTTTLTNNQSAPLGYQIPTNGVQVLNVPFASSTDTGLVTTEEQDFSGTKRLLNSPIIKPLTPGSVVFIGNDTTLSENNAKLFWDNTNGKLGIGTNAPANTLEIKSSGTNASGLTFTNLKNTTSVTSANTGLIGVDESGNVVRASVNRQFNTTTRVLNSPYLIDEFHDSYVNYTINFTLTVTVLGTTVGTVKLDIGPTNSGPWTPISTIGYSTSILSLLNVNTAQDIKVISGWIPKNYWVKLESSSHNVTISSATGQEVSME